REEQRPVDFAALRWLTARLRPRQRLRFEERLLLMLRLLLVVLLALLLARPVVPLAGDGAPWIVAAPGVAADALRAAVHSSAEAAAADARGDHGGDHGAGPVDIQRRWLAPGFPSLDDAPPPGDARTTISLLRELDMHMPTGVPLVVLVPSVLEGVDADRPRLSRPVEWRVLPAATAASPGAPASPAPRLYIEDAGSDAGARYLHAVAAAWRATHGQAGEDEADGDGDAAGEGRTDGGHDIGHGDGSTSTGLDLRAWLAPGNPPPEAIAWIEAGGTALLAHDALLPGLEDAASIWEDEHGQPLLRAARLGRGRALQWTRPLAPGALPALL